MRTINIPKYVLPGEIDAEMVYVFVTLVDASGNPIDGYIKDTDIAVIGERRYVITEATTIELTANTDIYPESYWNFRIPNEGRDVRNVNVSFDNGTAIDLVELLSLNISPGFWDVLENRIMPDPTNSTPGEMMAVSEEKKWVIIPAPAGTGDMQTLIYDPTGKLTDAFNIANLYGNLDGGVFT